MSCFGRLANSQEGLQPLTDAPHTAELQARWIESAIEQKLLDAGDAARILLEAVQRDRSPLEVVREQYANSPERFSDLSRLLNQLAGVETELPCGPQQGERDTDITQAAGKSTRNRTSSGASGSKASSRMAPEPEQSHTIKLSGRRTNSGLPTGSASGSEKSPSPNLGGSPRIKPDSSSEFPSGLQRYEVTAEVGRGGCGVVNQAHDVQLNRNVVLKRILGTHSASDEVVQRFINEARITGQLEHPGIVPVYELGVDDEALPFYAMKEVRGETLATKIAAVHQMPKGADQQLQLRQLLDRFLSVCQTLAFAHQAGVIHRDLKPANVMVGEFGETILLDWGLARQLPQETPGTLKPPDEALATVAAGQSGSKSKSKHSGGRSSPTGRSGSGIRSSSDLVGMTRQGTVLGTAAYMSPEQARGQNERVNKRSDVFSLGVMLYEILSGESPFRSETLQTTMERVAKCEYQPLRELKASIPRPLAAICAFAMQREQQARYQSAREMAEDLQNYLSGGSVSVYTEKPWEKLDRAANNHRGLFRAIFASSLLIAIVALVAVGKISRANRLERHSRMVAVDAKNQAEASLKSEQAARQRTREQLVASRKAADNWLIDLSGDLQFYPGLGSIRESLIQQGLQHYEQLLSTAKADLAAIRTSLAPSPSPRKRDEGSLFSDRFLAQGDSAPDDSAQRALTSSNASELGDTAEARVTPPRRVGRTSPEGDLSLLREVGFCALRVGDLHRLNQTLDLAGSHYRQAERVTLDALELAGDHQEPRLSLEVQLANAKIGLALVAAASVNNSPASLAPSGDAPIQQAIQRMEGLVRRHPDFGEARNALIRAYLVASRAAASGNSSEPALGFLDQALPHADILLQQDQSSRNRKLQGTLLEDRARLLFRSGRYSEAAQASRDLVRFYDTVLRGAPDRPDVLESRSLGHSLLGSSLLGQTDVASARESYDHAEQDLERAWDLLYGEAFYRENRVILATNRASASKLADRDADTEIALREAIAESRWLLQAQGVNADRIYRMARCYQSLTQVLLKKRVSENEGRQAQSELDDLLQHTNVLIGHLQQSGAKQVRELQRDQWLLQAYRAVQQDLPHLARQRLAELRQAIAQGRELANEKSRLLLGQATMLEATLPDPHGAPADDQENVEDMLTHFRLAARSSNTSISQSAHRRMLELLCWGTPSASAPTDLEPAVFAAREWIRTWEKSPSAWHWLAVALCLDGDSEAAEKALQKAVRLRGGESTVEDDLLSAAVAFQLDKPTATAFRLAAIERAQTSAYTSPHQTFLAAYLESLSAPTEDGAPRRVTTVPTAP